MTNRNATGPCPNGQVATSSNSSFTRGSFRFSADDRADLLDELPGREKLIDKIEKLLAEFWPGMEWERDFRKRARHARPRERKRAQAVAAALREATTLLEAECKRGYGVWRLSIEHDIKTAMHKRVSLRRFIDDAKRITSAIDEMARGMGGRPRDDAVSRVARLVAVALERDGVRCTTYDNGTLANVLGIVFQSLGLPDRTSLRHPPEGSSSEIARKPLRSTAGFPHQPWPYSDGAARLVVPGAANREDKDGSRLLVYGPCLQWRGPGTA